MEATDLDLQGHFGHFDLEVQGIWLVRMLTYNGYELGSPNLNQKCILGFSQQVLKMGVIDLDLQGHLAISTKKNAIQRRFCTWIEAGQGVLDVPNVLLFI